MGLGRHATPIDLRCPPARAARGGDRVHPGLVDRHLLLAGHFLGFESTGKAFEVLIQLGAILAILWVYAGRLIKLAADLPSSPLVRRFVLGVLITFLPAAIIGALAHDFIKTVLFETPKLICIMLIIGGVVLLFVDRWRLNPRYHEVMEFPMSAYLGIGIIQCLAMIPGTSHSGSTIVGGLLLGPDKRAAAEFSFYLVMPTMVGGIRARPLREPPHSRLPICRSSPRASSPRS